MLIDNTGLLRNFDGINLSCMSWLIKELSIPRPLQYLHGRSASLRELCLNYGLVLAAGLAFTYAIHNEPWSPVRKILLLLLAIDIAGGVISNLTAGTKRFYNQDTRLRNLFICLHIVQPMLMILLFPLHIISIGLMAIYTLGAAYYLNRILYAPHQKVVAGCLLTAGILGTLFTDLPPVVNVLILLFQVKLIVSFSIKW